MKIFPKMPHAARPPVDFKSVYFSGGYFNGWMRSRLVRPFQSISPLDRLVRQGEVVGEEFPALWRQLSPQDKLSVAEGLQVPSSEQIRMVSELQAYVTLAEAEHFAEAFRSRVDGMKETDPVDDSSLESAASDASTELLAAEFLRHWQLLGEVMQQGIPPSLVDRTRLRLAAGLQGVLYPAVRNIGAQRIPAGCKPLMDALEGKLPGLVDELSRLNREIQRQALFEG